MIDRLTFRANVMQTTSSKRKKYEDFLAKVEVLTSLDKYVLCQRTILNETAYRERISNSLSSSAAPCVLRGP